MCTALIYTKTKRGMRLLWESEVVRDREAALKEFDKSGYDIYHGDYILFTHKRSQ